MSSKIKSLSILTLAIVFGVFAGAAAAQDTTTTTKDNVQKSERFERRGKVGPRGEGFRGMRHGGGLGLLRGINLTDAQKQQIHTILESNKPDQATMDQLKAIHETAKAGGELTADQKAQIKAIREAQQAKMESVHQQILNLLTAEQKQQLEQRKQEMRQQMEERKLRQRNRPTTDKLAPKPTDG